MHFEQIMFKFVTEMNLKPVVYGTDSIKSLPRMMPRQPDMVLSELQVRMAM